MALNIKDPEADRLARELAALTGMSITAALREALEDKIASTKARKHAASKPSLDDIIARGRARTMLDERSDEEILGYDEHGLPA